MGPPLASGEKNPRRRIFSDGARIYLKRPPYLPGESAYCPDLSGQVQTITLALHPLLHSTNHKLTRARESLGLTKSALADMAALDPKTIKRGEDGIKLRRETRFKILNALNGYEGYDKYMLRDLFDYD